MSLLDSLPPPVHAYLLLFTHSLSRALHAVVWDSSAGAAAKEAVAVPSFLLHLRVCADAGPDPLVLLAAAPVASLTCAAAPSAAGDSPAAAEPYADISKAVAAALSDSGVPEGVVTLTVEAGTLCARLNLPAQEDGLADAISALCTTRPLHAPTPSPANASFNARGCDALCHTLAPLLCASVNSDTSLVGRGTLPLGSALGRGLLAEATAHAWPALTRWLCDAGTSLSLPQVRDWVRVCVCVSERERQGGRVRAVCV